MDGSLLAVTVLLGLVGLRWILLGVGAALLLRPVSSCPACFQPTLLQEVTWLIRRAAPWLEWRFCPHCRWQGPARRVSLGASPVTRRQ